MPIFNQEILIDQLNKYLKYENRTLILKLGYCHGLSLLWLHYISTGDEELFYATIKKIIGATKKSEFEPIKPSIEKFLSTIEWLQHSDHYVMDIHQSDHDKLLEVSHKQSICFLFTRVQLNGAILEMIPDEEMVCLSSINHSIGIFKRNNQYHLYDPNNEKGEAIVFNNIEELGSEIISCFYDSNSSREDTYPISFTIASDNPVKNKNTQHLLKKLLFVKDHVNDESYNGFTNLYFASRDGNISEVSELLKINADANHACSDGWTPLLAAASKGYYGISKKLIDHGANVNYANNEKYTALYLCVDNGYNNVAELLMNHGADPLLTNKFGHSSIYAALKNKNWNMAAIILNHVNHLDSLSNMDKVLLLNHKNEMTFAINYISKLSVKNYFKHILQMCFGLYNSGLLNRLFSYNPSNQTVKNADITSKKAVNSAIFSNISSKKTAS